MRLSFDERKWLLKCYWKVENIVEIQRRWRVEFGTLPPTRKTITRIRDNFEVDGTVQDVLKGQSGAKKNYTDMESANAIMQVFARFPKKSLRQCFRAIGIDKSSVLEFWELENDIPLATMQTLCRSVRRRYWECTVSEGGHFEHVRA